MSWFRNDRGDYAVLRVVLVLLALVAPVALAVTAASFAGDRSVEWHGDIAGLGLEAPAVPAADGASITYADAAVVEVDDPSTGLWWLVQAPDLTLALAVSVVAWLLLRLVAATRSGRPFADRVVGSLRLVAGTLVVAGVVVPALRGVADAAVLDRAYADGVDGFGWDLGVTFAWALVALLVLTIAEAFEHGARLSADVEGLV